MNKIEQARYDGVAEGVTAALEAWQQLKSKPEPAEPIPLAGRVVATRDNPSAAIRYMAVGPSGVRLLDTADVSPTVCFRKCLASETWRTMQDVEQAQPVETPSPDVVAVCDQCAEEYFHHTRVCPVCGYPTHHETRDRRITP